MTTTPLSKRIFLIDDDPVTNLINSKIIARNFDFSVNVFTDAQDALSQLDTTSTQSNDQFPDIILLDINMPTMDGWEFLTQFEKRSTIGREKCQVFMLTSSIDPEDVEKSKTYKSVREFISKPLTPEKFKKLLAA